ncbi:unnamed protein product [Linum trigynum]|uniref:Uncharacterized protein n=1 Tax=Linum trigynum TaxID=586398 RepID=A0AAV2FGH2_9ROSI
MQRAPLSAVEAASMISAFLSSLSLEPEGKFRSCGSFTCCWLHEPANPDSDLFSETPHQQTLASSKTLDRRGGGSGLEGGVTAHSWMWEKELKLVGCNETCT